MRLTVGIRMQQFITFTVFGTQSNEFFKLHKYPKLKNNHQKNVSPSKLVKGKRERSKTMEWNFVKPLESIFFH